MPSAAWFLLTLVAAASWCGLCLSQSPCPCPYPQQTHCRWVDQSAAGASDSPSCLNGSIPCKTLNYALLTNLTSDTCILVSGGNHTYDASPPSPVTDVSNLLIAGAGQAETIVSCDNISGLAFIRVTELTIANLSFVNCEAERNSTTYYDDSITPEPFLVGLYCWLCANVTMNLMQVSDSSGIGVVFYETGGNNNILNSVFSHNRFSMDQDFKGGGGGVTVEYPFCPPGTPKPDCNGNASSYNHNSRFQFSNCTFEENYSYLKNSSEYTFIRPENDSHIAFGRGGGLTLYFRGEAQGNDVYIQSCTFSYNTALFGGGLLSEFQDTSTNNGVFVLQSHFLYNDCPYTVNVGTSGGGIRIGFTFLVKYSSLPVANSFFMEDTKFIGNKAYVGGGLSLITGKQSGNSRSFYVSNCDWINNTARLGAAMDVTKWGNVQDGFLPIVEVLNCTFVGNSIWYMEGSQYEIVGCGVVYADTVPVHFVGAAKFIDNTGSGIAIRSTFVTFIPLEADGGGSAIFQRNRARDGGGIAIYGDAWIEVNPGYALEFIDNHAFYRGGAIFYEDVGNRNLLSSRRCFIQYSESTVPHEHWNASFRFVNNTARQNGNSIFCTSLIPCVWGGVEGSGSLSPNAIRKTFHWNETIFSYECTENNCTNEIASGPSNVTFTNPAANNSSEGYFVFSGEQTDIPFHAIDDLGLHMNASFYVSTSGHALYVKSNVASKHYTVTGCPNATKDNELTFFSIEDLPLRVNVNVSISECPPGFVKQDPPHCSCVCLPEPDYIANCNNSNMTAMMRQGRWTGCLNVDESSPLHFYSDYVYGHCSQHFCSNEVVPLVNDTNLTCKYLNDYICNYTGQKRAGVLCSGCKDGYGISLTSWDYQCVKCPAGAGKSAAAFFILLSAEILPLLLFIILIMMFDINILAAPVYSFIFFCQVKHVLLPLELYEKSELYTSLTTADRFFSGLLNLRFFGLFIPDTASTCISQNLNVLDILIIRYSILFFPVLIIGITLSIVKAFFSGYCCGHLQTAVGKCVHCMNKVKENWTPGASILHGLCGFLVLTYADLVRISTIILTPAYLYDANGLLKETRVRVQGDMLYFHSRHLPYAFVAILVLTVLVVLPCFLLLTHPLLHQFLVYCKLGERRPFKWIVTFYVSNRLKPIFDCFQGCFQEKMGFFAGLFLFYRIAFLLVVVIAENKPTHLLLAKLLLILIIFFLHSFFQPYSEKKTFVNKVDSYMFLLMGALVAIVYFNYVEATNYNTPEKAWLWIQLVVQYLPYVYLLFLVVWYMRHSIKRRLRRYRCCCWWKPLLLDREMEESYGAFDQDRRGAVQDEWLDEN